MSGAQSIKPGAFPSADTIGVLVAPPVVDPSRKGLYRVAGVAALVVLSANVLSLVMLRGGIFGKATAWIGLIGFTFLSIFTIWSTFVTALYAIAFYVFGMIGGVLALAWFVLVALKCFKLGEPTTAWLKQRSAGARNNR